MTRNTKNTKLPYGAESVNSVAEKGSYHSKAPYFIEKDKQAIEFLRKNPVPKKFLK